MREKLHGNHVAVTVNVTCIVNVTNAEKGSKLKKNCNFFSQNLKHNVVWYFMQTEVQNVNKKARYLKRNFFRGMVINLSH